MGWGQSDLCKSPPLITEKCFRLQDHRESFTAWLNSTVIRLRVEPRGRESSNVYGSFLVFVLE